MCYGTFWMCDMFPFKNITPGSVTHYSLLDSSTSILLWLSMASIFFSTLSNRFSSSVCLKLMFARSSPLPVLSSCTLPSMILRRDFRFEKCWSAVTYSLPLWKNNNSTNRGNGEKCYCHYFNYCLCILLFIWTEQENDTTHVNLDFTATNLEKLITQIFLSCPYRFKLIISLYITRVLWRCRGILDWTLDSGSKGCGFDSRQCLKLLSFSKTLYPHRLMWHVCAPKVAPGQNAPQGVEKMHL